MNVRLKEIEVRLAAIKTEMATEGANLEALEQETDSLLEERTKLLKEVEHRQAILGKIGAGLAGTGSPVVEEPEERNTLSIDSPEYRTAFLKSIRNLELSDVEKRVMTTATGSAGAAVPTSTANKIIEKAKQHAPVLNEIDLMHIKGNVTIPAEGTTVEAKIHTEGAQITADDDKLKSVTLAGFEVTKLLTISKSVDTMSIDAFEGWLVNKIGRAVAEKITNLIFNGSGANEAQGINAITWDNTNSVTVAKTASLTEANVVAAIGLLNGGYDAEAKWYMSKKTFFNSFHPLMNIGKNNLVTYADGKYYVGGYLVEMDERITLNEAFLGNLPRGYVGNMAEDITVTSQFVARQNSYDILGSSIFDGKVSAVEAFVKIIKETA